MFGKDIKKIKKIKENKKTREAIEVEGIEEVKGNTETKAEKKKKVKIGKFGLINNFLPYCFLKNSNLQIIEAPPKNMAEMLIRGEIDYAPVPSYFYLKNSKNLKNYKFCIASKGEVLSVIVVSRKCKLSDKIAVTSETMTSVNLLKIILNERDIKSKLIPSKYSKAEDLLKIADMALVIGDEAIKARMLYRVVMDLGEEWFNFTGLPMVFGISASLKDVNLEYVDREILNSTKKGFDNLDDVVNSASELFKMPEEFLEKYFKILIYKLGSKERKGLKTFEEMLFKV